MKKLKRITIAVILVVIATQVKEYIDIPLPLQITLVALLLLYATIIITETFNN